MDIATVLDAVMVFREGALCTRRARVVPPPEGLPAALRLVGLPLSLEAASLRARVIAGPAGLRVNDVRPAFDVQIAAEVDVPVEQKALEAAQGEVARLRVARARVESEITELAALRPRFPEPKRGAPPREANVPSMIALAEFSATRLAERLERRRKLEREIEDAEEEVLLRERRLREASTANRTERARLGRAALITLSARASEPIELALEYQVSGARWVPAYELRLDRAMASGALRMRASVAQRTGEDWQGVSLSLSTASLSRRADVPELKSLRIGRSQAEPPRAGFREPPPGLDDLFADYDKALHGGPPPASAATRRDDGDRTAIAAQREMRVRQARSQDVVPSSPQRPAAPPQPAKKVAAPSTQGAPPRGMPPVGAAAAPPPAAMSLSAPAPMSAPMPQRSAQMAPPSSGGFGGGAMSKAIHGAAPESLDDRADMEMARSPGSARAAGMRRRMESEAFDGAAMLAESEANAFDEPAPMAAPEHTLGEALLDYDRLAMSAPGASDRGRLQPRAQWDLAFAASVSVDVSVVLMAISRAQAEASSIASLDEPAGTRRVESLDCFDYRYDCAARADVASTGQWVTVPVMESTVGLTPEFVCVPAVEPRAWRTLQVDNLTLHALLPGPVDVSAGDEFLLTASLPAIAPGAWHRLGLGVEESIKVARRTQYRETTGGLLGGSMVLVHEVEVELNNRLAAPAPIEVRERVPVAQPGEKDLKVEEGDVKPPWEKVEQPIDGVVIAGARRWRVTVPAGERVTLRAQFSIRMPGDRMLAGGNRRV